MSTVTVTFVHTTFILVTFVHTSHISVVTNPILTKNFVPNIFGGLNIFGPKEIWSQFVLDQHFGGYNLFWPNFFQSYYFWTLNLLRPKIEQFQKHVEPKFFDLIIFLIQNFFYTKCFGSKIFLEANCFWTPNCFGPKQFFDPKFFWPNIFLVPNIFLTQNFSGPKIFLTEILLTQNIFVPNFCNKRKLVLGLQHVKVKVKVKVKVQTEKFRNSMILSE